MTASNFMSVEANKIVPVSILFYILFFWKFYFLHFIFLLYSTEA